MLSILIPTYNYNAFPLVLELKRQADYSEIDYEIIVQDDASFSALNSENQNINTIKNCFFFVNNYNLGRAGNLNSLVAKAKFEWVLFLDCDTFPTQDKFIKNYIKATLNNNSIVFGGIVYKNKKPKKEAVLRWVYGQKREALSLSERNKNPAYSGLTSNLLIKKDILKKHPFDDSITQYGYEDLCFFSELNKNHFEVTHIENPTYHLDLETSGLFLKKTQKALDNLLLLEKSKKLSAQESKIIAVQQKLENLKLTACAAYMFSKIKSKIESNLLSKKPSLFWFDIYKLGYYCTLKK